MKSEKTSQACWAVNIVQGQKLWLNWQGRLTYGQSKICALMKEKKEKKNSLKCQMIQKH